MTQRGRAVLNSRQASPGDTVTWDNKSDWQDIAERTDVEVTPSALRYRRVKLKDYDSAYHHWRLDESSGSTATDSEGTVDGSYQNASLASTTGPDGEQAPVFNGQDSYVETSGGNIIAEFNKRGTVAIWFRPESLSETQWLVSAGYSDQRFAIAGYRIGLVDGEAYADFSEFGCTSNNQIVRGGSPDVGEWNHLVFVLDQPNLTRLYLNSFRVDELSHGCPLYKQSKTGPPVFGQSLGDGYFNGSIADVRGWDNTALSDNQVAKLFDDGATVGY